MVELLMDITFGDNCTKQFSWVSWKDTKFDSLHAVSSSVSVKWSAWLSLRFMFCSPP